MRPWCNRYASALVVLAVLSGAAAGDPPGRTYVRHVRFYGNRTFERSRLLAAMELLPSRLFKRTVFSHLRLRIDMRNVEAFYRNRGFIGVSVDYELVRHPSKRHWVDIKVLVREGRRAMVRSVTIASNPVITDTGAAFLRTRRQKPLDVTEVEADARAIRDTLGAMGFLTGKAEYTIHIDSAAYVADVAFAVRTGPRVVVEQTHVAHPHAIHQRVIKRELEFEPGDTLTARALRASERRLYRTGLFRFVRIEPVPEEWADTVAGVESVSAAALAGGAGLGDDSGSGLGEDGKAGVVVAVDETDYWLLEGGLGYSSEERFRISARLSYANLFRRGHRVSLQGKLSSIEQDAMVSYATPWLFLAPLETELSGFYRRHDTLFFAPALAYTGEFAGFTAGVGQEMDYGLSYKLRFHYENVLRVSSASVDTLPKGISTKNTRSIIASTAYDRRNDIFLPTRGYYGILSTQLAGIFGKSSNQFIKVTTDQRAYASIREKVFFASGLRLGWVREYAASKRVPLQEQFFEGGPRSVRGYELDRLVFDSQGRPQGGNVAVVAHVIDVWFPLIWWIKGAAFLDAGYVWDDLSSVDPGDIRYGAGPGLRVRTPLGMIRFDAGFKLNPRKGESRVRYYFYVGEPF